MYLHTKSVSTIGTENDVISKCFRGNLPLRVICPGDDIQKAYFFTSMTEIIKKFKILFSYWTGDM